jgi:hypothetical protein
MNLEFVTKSTAGRSMRGFSAPVVKINPNNSNITLTKAVMATLRGGDEDAEVRVGFAFDGESKFVGIYLSDEGLKASKSGTISNAGICARIQSVQEVDLGDMVGQFDIDLENPIENEQVGNIYSLAFDKTLEPRKTSKQVEASVAQEPEAPVAVAVEDEAPMAVAPEEVTDMMPTEATPAELEGDNPTPVEDVAIPGAASVAQEEEDEWPG